MKRPLHFRSPRPGETRRGATLSLFALAMLPVCLLLALFAWNVRLIDQQRAAQRTAADACALAAAQSLVDDRMLAGSEGNLATLEDLGRDVARFYADLNPLWPGSGPASRVALLDDDIQFSRSPSPLDPSLQIIDGLILTGRRDAAAGNPLPLIGGAALARPTVDVQSTSKVMLDRRVAGLKPRFGKNLPLAPIAIDEAVWASQVESVSPPGTLTMTLAPPDAAFLKLGAIDDGELADQIVNGVAPGHLAELGGQLLLDATSGRTVDLLTGVDARSLKSACQGLADRREQRIWLLVKSTSASQATVARLAAARIQSVADVLDPMTGDAVGVTLTLQPSFFSSPAVITEAGRTSNPYLCRIRLSN